MEADEMTRLRKATKTGRPPGSEPFVGKLEARLERRLKRYKTGLQDKSELR